MSETKRITYAYVRVSTKEQNLDRQYTAIKEYRPDIKDSNIFADKQTGKEFSRDGYNALKYMIKHDRENHNEKELTIELIIKEIDRLGRNYQGIMRELRWFQDQGVVLRIIEIPTTLTDFDGEQSWLLNMITNLTVELYAGIAQQEIEKRHMRQMEGIAEAKKKGKQFGRKPVQVNDADFSLVAGRAVAGEITHTAAMEQLGLKRNTYYKHLNRLFKEETK